MRFFIHSVIALAVFLLSPNVYAEVRFCPRQPLAKLSDRESCRARFQVPTGGSLCISRIDWTRLLAEGKGACGVWTGRWTVHEKAYGFVGKKPGETSTASFVPIFVERRREHLSRLLAEVDPLGILAKLLLDEDRTQTPDMMLRLLGFVHLLTASGIHLYALSAWIETICLFFARFFLRGRVPVPVLILSARVCGLLSWCGIWLLCGLRLGLLRPWLVVGLRFLARITGVQWRWWSPLVAALLIDFVAGGGGAYGRLRYALAVGGCLLAIQSPRAAWRAADHLRMAVGSWLPVAVVDLWQEGLIAVATPVLSLVTLPLITTVIYPVLILAAGLDLSAHAEAAKMLMRLDSRILTWIVETLFGWAIRFETLWYVPRWAWLLGAFFSGLYLYVRSVRRRVVTGCCVLLFVGMILFLRVFDPYSGRRAGAVLGPKVEQLDVGQGDCALVTDSSQFGLVDTGSGRTRRSERWLARLAEKGVDRIDWVLLTHLDEDHAGGLLRIARWVRVGCVTMPRAERVSERGRRLESALASLGVPVREPARCFPYEAKELVGRGARNNHMLAALIRLGDGKTFVSFGDADEREELQGAAWVRSFDFWTPQTVVLKVSHHGAKSSTSSRLLARLRPVEAWISAGVGNRYGHPSEAVLKRLEQAHVPVKRTDRDGDLSVTIDNIKSKNL